VVLGEAGVSIKEIPTERIKLPVDDWVDVEDLGMDDDTHLKDVDPVEMATPAPSQKVWLASDVNRVGPVPYSKAGEVDNATEQPTSARPGRRGLGQPRGRDGHSGPRERSSRRRTWEPSPT
jgi:hypothetical protein